MRSFSKYDGGGMRAGFKQAATEGNSSGGLIYQCTAPSFYTTEVTLRCPPPSCLSSVTPPLPLSAFT